tara:strand:- start:150362 stop:150940 length:579 start_codon:yes stop_codon:yes gene_type:complete
MPIQIIASQVTLTRNVISFLLLVITGMASANAETTSQRFSVFVPVRAKVVTPTTSLASSEIAINDIATNHIATRAPQMMPPQHWSLSSTSPSGMVAEFALQGAFANESNPEAKIDAGLIARVQRTSGNGRWGMAIAQDKTNHQSGDESAAVYVTSTAAGNAAVELQVGLAGSTDVPQGKYSTTVVCTIAPRD